MKLCIYRGAKSVFHIETKSTKLIVLDKTRENLIKNFQKKNLNHQLNDFI